MQPELSKTLERVLCFVVIGLFVNAVFATGVLAADATDAGGATAPDAAASDSGSNATASYSCATESLTDKEANAINNLLKDGFVGKEMSSGAAADKDREMLDNNSVILTTPDENVAAKATLPGGKTSPDEMGFLMNTHIKGAFAYGIVLEETLRTGRCADMNVGCAVAGSNLMFSNAGAGFVSGAKNVYNDFRELWDDNAKAPGLSEEQDLALKGFLDEQDKNSMTYNEMKRVQGDAIKNSIMSDRFDAELQTNCVNSACILNSYSMFDKYFNSGYSGSNVFSSFGPTLVGRMSKAFGYAGRRYFPWRFTESKLYSKLLQTKLFQPESMVNVLDAKAVKANLDKTGMTKIFEPMFAGPSKECPAGHCLGKTESFETFFNTELANPGGLLDLADTPEKRKAVYKAAKYMERYFSGQEAIRAAAQSEYEAIAKAFAYGSPQEVVARIKYGQTWAKIAANMDDSKFISFDWPDMWKAQASANMGPMAVKDVNPYGDFKLLYEDPRNLRTIFDKFSNTPTEEMASKGFAGWQPIENQRNMAFETAEKYVIDGKPGDPRAIQLFMSKPDGAPEGYMSLGDIEDAINAGKKMDYTAKLGHGLYVPIKPETLSYIKSKGGPLVEIYKTGFKPVKELTPEALAGNITTSRARSWFTPLQKQNSRRILDAVEERGFSSRRYASVLDKAFSEEQQLIKNYFSLKGGAKWTFWPYMYWGWKRGFGVKDLSIYMLPETWHSLKIYHKDAAIYDDAYIDFFANEGSDQGDMFIAVLNKLPWKMILNEVSEQFNPMKNFYDAITKNEIRSETENLAFYLSGPKECTQCSATFVSDTLEKFSISFNVRANYIGYILEDTISEAARAKGQTLITFAHHMNLKGQRTDDSKAGSEIDIEKAVKDKDTCADKVKDLPINFTHADLGSKAGLAIGTLEMVSYVTFNWAGLFSSIAIQTMLTPKLQDCVDAEEGYYVHYFVPAKKEEAKAQDLKSISTEKVSEMVDKGKTLIQDGLSGVGDSFTQDAVNNLGNELDKFSKGASESNLVQITLHLNGASSGTNVGRKLFYIWVQGGAELVKSGYATEGKSVITDPATGQSITIDNKTGKITDGNRNVLVGNEDLTRLSFDNLAIPAREIPQTITKVGVPGDTNPLIEINARGDATVLNSTVLDCIAAGVEAQTGLPFNGSNLASAFGKVEAVVTTTHPNIVPESTRIIAEGIPRKVDEGSDAKLTILGNMETSLSKSTDGQPAVGTMKMIKFKNGQIIYKEETKELLVWLRHHEDGILSQNDVAGVKAKLTTVKNPETNCDEPAVDLQFLGNSDSDISMYRTQQFNKSLEHMGPFQIFDTQNKRYVLYTDKDCKEHLRVIDKATGEITDYVGKVEQTPTGLKITTEDGQEHTLDFSAEDGIPKVSFDKGPLETLTSAQGRNGSFWYDPKTGLMYAENAQLIPWSEAFKQFGMAAKANPDGTVTAAASGNVVNIDTGGSGLPSLLNLPSIPEQPLYLLIFIIGLLSAFVAVRTIRIEN